jgi:hypothetical protein
MSREAGVVDRLRAAFAADVHGAGADGPCPEPGEIWDACHGQAGPEDSRRIVAHMAGCPSCSAEWRMAMQDTPRNADQAPRVWSDTRPAARGFRRGRWIGIAAAAVIIIGFTGPLLYRTFQDQRGAPAVFRSSDSIRIRSLVAESETLQRDACVLTWSATDEGSTYDLEIAHPTLEIILIERTLDGTEYRVPPEALAEVPAGGRIVWRVEARLPDGRTIASPAFIHRVD